MRNIYFWSSLNGALAGLLAIVISTSPMAEDVVNTEITVKLLSDQAADDCTRDKDCFLDLFLRATLGDEAGRGEQRLVKWEGGALAASVLGRHLPAALKTNVDKAMLQMTLLANTVGVDIKLAGEGTDGVVNLVYMISDDLQRDRDDSFSEFIHTVFAGRFELYDDLATGQSPICSSQIFVDDNNSINGGLALAETKEEASRLGPCLQRIMLNGLGLRYTLPTDMDSMLNPESERKEWTSVDYLLLRLLYHPLIERGMDEAAITAIFPKLHQDVVGPSS